MTDDGSPSMVPTQVRSGEVAPSVAFRRRAVISDVVSDEDVPRHLKEDPDLWSGCISGAFTETGLLEAFEEAGFHGITILERSDAPWQTVDGIEFRSMTVAACKGKQGPCIEKHQAVIYKGPWKSVQGRSKL